MKIFLIFAVFAACAFAANPGLKVRVTKKALDELTRTAEGLMKKDWDKAKEVFKNKIENVNWPPQTGIFSAEAKVKDFKLVSWDQGEGKLEFAEPNIIKGSHKGVDFKFEVTVQDAGKTGTITAEVKNLDSTLGVAISSQDGKFQFTKSECQIAVESATVNIKGFGAEKDKKYTKTAQDLINNMISTVDSLFCPSVEMMLAMVSTKILEGDCKLRLGSNFDYSFCLTESPKATADYMEIAICGATTLSSVSGVPADYNPAPLAMSDEGVSKMLYLWEAEAAHNYFFKTMFEAGKLVFAVCKDTYPKLAEKIQKKIIEVAKEFGKTISDSADIKTVFKAEDAPVVTYDSAKPNSFSMKGKLRITHKINDGGQESTMYAVFAVEASSSFEIQKTEKGKMFPRVKVEFAVDKLSIEETSETIAAEMKAQHEEKAKKEMPKMLNKLFKEYMDEAHKWMDKNIKPWMRVVQLTEFDVKILEKTSEASASVKFDILKLSQLQKKIAEQQGIN
jgi:hypothetical protein